MCQEFSKHLGCLISEYLPMAIAVSTDDPTSKYCLDVNIVKNEMTANALHVFEVSNKST